MLIWPDLIGDVSLGLVSILPEFGDICTESLACSWLHTDISTGPGIRQCSTSAAGDTLPSYDSGLPCLSTLQPFRPPIASSATAGVRLFELDDIVSCVMQLPHLSALLPVISVLCTSLELLSCIG